jgi:PAS domain S-box-containing protein
MMDPIRILYVDDNPLDRDLVRDSLEREQEGFQLIEASSRQEFEERLQEGNFDLVLSDFNILGFEGLQVIEAVKAKDPDLPVIIVTGTGSEEIAVESMRSGAADYIIKTPNHIKRLPVTIGAVLEKRHLQIEKEQAEAALRRSEAKYRELVENANSIILRLDPEGRITFFNEFAQLFFGYPLEEILGQHALGSIVPEIESTGLDLRAKISDLVRHPERYAFTDNENMRRNGDRVWVSWTNKAIRDTSGMIKEILCVGNDITELRRAQEAFTTLVNSAPIGIYIAQDGRFRLLNPAIPKLTGYLPSELVDRDVFLLVAPEFEPLVREQTRKMLEMADPPPVEFQIITKDGQRRWIMETIAPTLYDGGRAVLGYCLDITEQKEMAHQLLQAQKMEAIGILAGGLAHDFNNLLTAIMGYSEIMMMDLRQDDPFHLYVEEIAKAASRGASLTNRLLAFSRKQILQPRVVNLNEVVLDLEKMLRRLIGEDIELLTVIDQELGPIKGDPGQIEQIIMNLAVNARDAMPEGGKLTIETANVFLDEAYTRGHVGLAPGPYVMLAVSDNGTGMDAETMSHIFEPFYTTKESGKGTGLGLATVYGIVKQSGGNICFYSEPGQGTTCKVYLPRVAEGEVEVRPKTTPSTPLAGKETILLVEDDAALRELICTALRRQGFAVLEAANGGEALLICENQKAPIHLVLTDVVMPQMSGSALAERLQLIHPEMKVLYMSGYTENAIVQAGVLESKINFIPKPFRMLSLMQKVREVLDTASPL